jgi:hypothetical protein
MALTIRHATLSNVQDEGVPGEIGPTEWNEGHAITGVLVNQFLAGDGTGSAAPRAIVGSDLPNPSVLDRGGVFAVAPISKRWVAYIDTNGQPQLTQPATGDLSCSATNDSAAAGALGESTSAATSGTQATVTISNASPAVVSDTGHGLSMGAVVHFTTTGALPTGLTAGTNYYVSGQGFGANSYSVSTSAANALAGVSINTSSAGSGTHTRNAYAVLTTVTNIDIVGVSLGAGDWDIGGSITYLPGATTTVNSIQASVSTASATLGPDVEVTKFGFNAMTLVNSHTVPAGPWRISLAATTIVYLVARSNFGTSTMSAYGKIFARRAR